MERLPKYFYKFRVTVGVKLLPIEGTNIQGWSSTESVYFVGENFEEIEEYAKKYGKLRENQTLIEVVCLGACIEEEGKLLDWDPDAAKKWTKLMYDFYFKKELIK